jgi:NAD(P)-dependent dehydrogenase (short-subunit alcohol dehydrogenase family)
VHNDNRYGACYVQGCLDTMKNSLKERLMDKRVAVVTGANRGLGYEVSRQLASRGVRVLMCSREAVKGEAAAARVRYENGDALGCSLDVTDAASVAVLAKQIEDKYGAADILVNNAGILIDPEGSRVLDSSFDTYRQTMEVNLFGPLQLCLALVPAMRENGYGRVVNFSSGLGQLSEMGAGTPAYRISKSALNALTRTLAAELAGSNVLVNAVCPGWVRTDMGGPQASRSVEQGADTAVWLATLPDGGPSGGFFRDRKPIAW